MAGDVSLYCSVESGPGSGSFHRLHTAHCDLQDPAVCVCVCVCVRVRVRVCARARVKILIIS